MYTNNILWPYGHSMSNHQMPYMTQTQILIKLHMAPVTQIEKSIFSNLTSYFHISGILKFFKNVNFRVNGIYKNPHCTKYISHRSI